MKPADSRLLAGRRRAFPGPSELVIRALVREQIRKAANGEDLRLLFPGHHQLLAESKSKENTPHWEQFQSQSDLFCDELIHHGRTHVWVCTLDRGVAIDLVCEMISNVTSHPGIRTCSGQTPAGDALLIVASLRP